MNQINPISIEEELKKNPDLKLSDIHELRKWCITQPHVPEISDSELIIFLHSNYYNLDSTKKTIDSYFTMKTQSPEFFANRDPLSNKDLRKIFHVTSAIPLKQLTKEGYHIILMRIQEPDASKYVFNDHIKFVTMALDLWWYSSGIINGHVMIYDGQNFSLGHATRVSLSAARKYVNYFQNCLPVRLKGLHFINISTGMSICLRMVKPFMKKEIVEMLHIHPTLESLSKFMPTEALPNEIGGKAGSLVELHDAEIKKFENHRDWFLEEESRVQIDKRWKDGKSGTQCPDLENYSNTLDID